VSAAPTERSAGRLATPALVLAADHRARGVVTVERHDEYLAAIGAALPHCDGILATTEPLRSLRSSGAITNGQRTYLSINRTGLAGSVFELDDRLVATVAGAAADGWTGVKIMTRIAMDDVRGAEAIELLGRVLEESRAAGLEAMVEAVVWRGGRMSKLTADIVLAAVIANDLGAPLLKVPVPEAPTGDERSAAVTRVVASVGVPVLFLGGPRRPQGPEEVLEEASDVMTGGGAGLAIGRAVLNDEDPGAMAAKLAAIVHGS
jgi:DhnA family fructose-bisphosphate aldolase class Ia